MRTVARELGVEAMSLYHHVAGKDALLDAVVERIFASIELPELERPWRTAMRERAVSARGVLAAHPWALGLIESRRTPSRSLLRHHDRVLGCLLRAGFSPTLAGHAFSVIDAYVYGFVLTESNLPFTVDEGAEAYVEELGALLSAEELPHLTAMLAETVVGQAYDFNDEFLAGLDLILDGLEQRRLA
jgi:AcrR family transcriptional regulator